MGDADDPVDDARLDGGDEARSGDDVVGDGTRDGDDVDGTDAPRPDAESDVSDGTTDESDPLAAVVHKERGDVVLAALREEGVYDDDRRLVEHGDGTLAIPVTAPPEADVLEVIRQRDPERRTRTLADRLRERGWSEDALASAPASWAVVGSVVLVDLPEGCHDESAVGEALLDLHRNADTVLAREGIDGQTREPDRRVLAGLGDTETVHDEHGVRYALDLADVMFSPGNKAERARMAALVAAGRGRDEPTATVPDDAIPDRVPDLDPLGGADDDGGGDGDGTDIHGSDEGTGAGIGGDEATDAGDGDPAEPGVREPTARDDRSLAAVGGPSEHVFDMFAGAGYFTLPAAIAGARVSAAEIDADTFGYLVENARLNGVGDRIAPYLADCRDLAGVLDADRVVMGHWDADEYLDVAMDVLRPGGVVHVHSVAPEPALPDRPSEQLERAAAEAGRDAEVVAVRRVKSYGEKLWHVVVDARIR